MKLNSSSRAERGRRAHALLNTGRLPAVVYGHRSESRPITLDAREFDHVFRQAGRTHLVDLVGEGMGRGGTKVLIKEVQTHPRHLGPIHVDLQAVSMTEKLQVEVPVITIGESPAVKTGAGEVLVVVHALRVECLPGDIPEAYEVDLAGLTEVGDQVRVGDLPMRDGVTIVADPEEVLVKVQPMRDRAAEEAEAEAEERAEGAEAAAPEAGAEDEEPDTQENRQENREE
jgi:large subunit ribosomal protein L25